MSKGRNVKTYTMNRQTKQYAMNAKRQALKIAGVKEPKKRVDNKTMAKHIKIFGIALLVITVLLTVIWGWWGLLAAAIIGVLTGGGYMLYLRKIDADWIRYYKAIELPKEQFMKQAAGNLKPKQRARVSKRWDSVK